MTDISVGIPTYNGFKAETAMSLVMGVQSLHSAGLAVHVSCRQGPYTHWNREHLVGDAIEAGVKHLMMIDADMGFPPDAINRLLSRDKDIIGGYYMMKILTDPPTSTIKMGEINEQGEFSEAPKNWTPPPEPFRCGAVATGFLLVNMRVFEKLESPYFPCVEPLGEDVAFCLNATKAGFEVWCDPTFKLDHIGDHAY